MAGASIYQYKQESKRLRSRYEGKEKELILNVLSLVCLCSINIERLSRLINKTLLKFKTEIIPDI